MTYTTQQNNESYCAISWSLKALNILLSPGKMYLCTVSTVLLLVTSEFY